METISESETNTQAYQKNKKITQKNIFTNKKTNKSIE